MATRTSVAVAVPDAQALRRIGPVQAWRRLKNAAPRDTTLVGLYALYHVLIGGHRNGLPAEVKEVLRTEAADAGRD